MLGLNYHHLYYFYRVARAGGVSAASRDLRVAQPTISVQLRQLEEALGVQLFVRQGRRLELTEEGRVAYRYAEDIFGMGRELVGALKGVSAGRPLRLVVGAALVVPKIIVERLLEPALALDQPLQLECIEDRLERLLAGLATHELDLVISDVPLTPAAGVKAFNHPLGSSGVGWFARSDVADRYRARFPESLEKAPLLLPTRGSALRRDLDRWLEQRGITPRVVGEFDDSALTKVFGQAGRGLFAAPLVIEAEIREMYQCEVVGRADEVTERFFAISVERRLKHPGVVAITTAARTGLFGGESG
jgi:LysR family transcriptional activator of nhaA